MDIFDILKEFINNPGLEHLAADIIRNMDVDKAMETMFKSNLLSDEERKSLEKRPNCYVRKE